MAGIGRIIGVVLLWLVAVAVGVTSGGAAGWALGELTLGAWELEHGHGPSADYAHAVRVMCVTGGGAFGFYWALRAAWAVTDGHGR